MPSEEMQIEIVVEYDGFIAAQELTEIMEIANEALWYEIGYFFGPPFWRHRFSVDQELPPLICISEANKGSLVLTTIIGTAAATYCYNRFKRGVRRSRLPAAIEEFGVLAGDNLGRVIERMNEWLGEYVEDAREKRSNLKSARVNRKKKKDG